MKTSMAVLQYFSEVIRKELGIVYLEANYYQLETRLGEVAQLNNCNSIDELYQLMLRGLSPVALRQLFDIATNNETYFYRDPSLFEAIDATILAEQKPNGQLFKVWSAACSFGQEIYSLAMLFESKAAKLPNGYGILATDVSRRAVTTAATGIYNDLQVQRGLSPALLSRFFTKVNPSEPSSDWQVRPELKRRVRFQEQNLLASFEGLGKFHLILCRNVLIYQSVERKREILSRLYRQLEPHGYLILGSSESLIGLSDDFEMVRTDKAVLYRAIAKLAQTG